MGGVLEEGGDDDEGSEHSAAAGKAPQRHVVLGKGLEVITRRVLVRVGAVGDQPDVERQAPDDDEG